MNADATALEPNPSASPPTEAGQVWRIEVWPTPTEPDPRANEAIEHLSGLAVSGRSAAVFLLEGPLDKDRCESIAHTLLADPVIEQAVIGQAPPIEGHVWAEAWLLPGVMDPVAISTQDAIAAGAPDLEPGSVRVATGVRYDLVPAEGVRADALREACAKRLINPVIQTLRDGVFQPESLPSGSPYRFELVTVPIRDLDEAGLAKLSREGHLFLTGEEMQRVQQYYQDLGREPTDIELETIAQTWSEHCVHKTLKSTVRYEPASPEEQSFLANKPGHTVEDDGSIRIDNLLKSTVAAVTFALRDGTDGGPALNDWLISVFDDNAGIVRFDEEHGVCIKVETHNHPSAIEPYGGAATGIGGCIRDIMGTGLAAKPIASTDVFCVAPPTLPEDELPKGVLPPRYTLERVVAGVRDYGNRMGIPTVNGAVHFHPDYVANPLVYCGCIGLIPLDQCFGDPKPGDRIIALGGATGRDGIHGATFSSDELTDTHADEFSHAVQIGNAITQKTVMDAILRARDHESGCLFTAITDCGAGGFSSAVGEMGEELGARVTLDTAPLKYDGLSYTEIWISEAQERMVLAVPADRVPELQAICDVEGVTLADLGEFGFEHDGRPALHLSYQGEDVGTLDMHFLHKGVPMPTRRATGDKPTPPQAVSSPPRDLDLSATLAKLLSHPSLSSKHWIVRQYDHEVQGGTLGKPLTGPMQLGPSDAAVIRPKPGGPGVVLASGLAPQIGEKACADGTASDGDSYWATLAAIDEAVRNAVCVGADPNRLAILDNFCWPKCDDPAVMGSLVRAAEACYDGALAYRTPFVSGKDSLSNQFTAEDGRLITIPATMLITAMGQIDDPTRALTSNAKAAGNLLFIVGETQAQLGGSFLAEVLGQNLGGVPRANLQAGPRNAKAVASIIAQGLAVSAHDISDGGLLAAAAEMAFAHPSLGVDLDLQALPSADGCTLAAQAFGESPSRYLLEVPCTKLDGVLHLLRDAGAPFGQIGVFTDNSTITVYHPEAGEVLHAELGPLREAWRGTLDW